MTLEYELIDLARAGSRDAIESLIAGVWPHAYRIARGVLHDPALAEDAAQEACAIVYREISKLRSATAFGVWFYRIVVRETLAVRRPDAALPAGVLPECVDRAETDRSVARLDVLRALASLAPHLRVAVVLRFYAGLNSREIARVLRVPDGTIRFRLMVARRKLERLLADGDAGTARVCGVTANAT
ncbi:MAG TPA: sigma-70 family RNA polymerase sigma factor [Candidatus Tumulicola sp.]|nr:sigma-70 family RNA polymerase sigma factor [Candidatus Tumulicola sp.]